MAAAKAEWDVLTSINAQMTTKASVFIATSLDGFIAREDGDIDWLPTPEHPESGEDYGYGEFIETVDAMVMGRHTFDLMSTFESWFYGDLPVFVLSNQNVEISEELSKTVSSMSGSPDSIVEYLREKGFEHLYVDGGKTIQGFLKDGLIDQMTITTIPILIGSGIPLFGPLPYDIHLEHLYTHSYADGLVQSKYKVLREG